jgi:dihydrofolate reductase
MLIYTMGVSLDGYIAGPAGEIDWTVPDEELHQFHNDRVRELGVHLCGRRLYEEMLYWETPGRDPEFGEVEREFAGIWRALPKVVFSTTLEQVEGNARLAKGSVADEVAALREEQGGDIEIGGAGLAAGAIEQGLVDEYRLFVYPTVLGGGTPLFPAGLAERIDLELVETRTFGSRVVYTRYRAATGRSPGAP